MTSMTSSMNRLRLAALCLGLCCLLYAGGMRHEFLSDDRTIVVVNVLLRDWANAPRLFAASWPHQIGASFVFYRPLVGLSFMIDYHLWGLTPTGFRMTNILLHAVNALLLYVLIVGSAGDGPSRTGAVSACLLFAAHPVQAEVVNFISARTESLPAFFWLLCMVFYSRGVPRGRPVYRTTYCLSIACFVGALLSKEVSVTLPLALLALDIFLLRAKGERPARLVARQMPFWIMTATYAVLRVTALQPVSLSSYGRELARAPLIDAGLRVMTLFLRLLALPFHLYQEYRLELVGSWQVVPMLAGTCVLLGWGLWAADSRGQRRLAFAVCWAAAALIPCSVILGRAKVDADRFLYLPSAAGAVMIVTLWPKTAATRKRLTATLVGIAAIFACLSIRQVWFWRDETAHWRRKLTGSPSDVTVRKSLGAAYFHAGRKGRAERWLARVVASRPDELAPRLNLSLVLIDRGNCREAARHLEAALRIEPDCAEAHVALAAAYNELDRLTDAERHILRAVQLGTRTPVAYEILASILQRTGREAEAAEAWEKARKLRGSVAR